MKKVYKQICFIIILFSIQTGFGQHLPAPTGKYKVGIASFVLQDTSRYDSVVRSYRPIMVKVWYPCSSNAASQPADYVIDDDLKRALLQARYFEQDSTTLVKMNRLKSSSFFEAPFYKKGSFPLIFFSPGWGVASINYTSIIEEVVSRGYVVVAIDHLYCSPITLASKKVIGTKDYPFDSYTPYTLAAETDIDFVYRSIREGGNPLQKLLNEHIQAGATGVMGHSIGGIIALDLSKKVDYITYAINLDGGLFEDLKKTPLKVPSLTIRSAPVYSNEDLAKRNRTRDTWEKMGKEVDSSFQRYLSNTDVEAVEIKVGKTGHMSYSDAPFVLPNLITRFGGQYLSPKENLHILNQLILNFLAGQRENVAFDQSIKTIKGTTISVKIYPAIHRR